MEVLLQVHWLALHSWPAAAVATRERLGQAALGASPAPPLAAAGTVVRICTPAIALSLAPSAVNAQLGRGELCLRRSVQLERQLCSCTMVIWRTAGQPPPRQLADSRTHPCRRRTASLLTQWLLLTGRPGGSRQPPQLGQAPPLLQQTCTGGQRVAAAAAAHWPLTRWRGAGGEGRDKTRPQLGVTLPTERGGSRRGRVA